MGLLNPRQIVTDAVSLAYRYAVLVADFVKRQVGVSTDGAYRVPVQLGLVVALAAATTIIPFGHSALSYGFGDSSLSTISAPTSVHHVGAVVFVGAEDKVVWINAGSLVAGMPDNQAIRDWAIEQDVGDLGVMPSPAVPDELQRGVALGVAGLLPEPASTIGYNVAGMEAANKVFNFHNSLNLCGVKPNGITTKGGRKV